MAVYKKPVITIDEGITEGVYAASGCYTASAAIHQTPETGRGDYRIQVNGVHNATHTNEAQLLTVSFNQEVTFKSCAVGSCVGSTTGTTITISSSYHQNQTDNIGFGDLVVESEPGLSITGVKITD